MSTRMGEDDWVITLTVFRACLLRRGRKAAGAQGGVRPTVSRSAALLNGGERALASAARAFRELEHGVEALRPAWQGGRLRGLLPCAGGPEFVSPPHTDVRLDHRARPYFGGRRKRGQQGQALGRSRGGFTTKTHAKSDASGTLIGFDLTGGEKGDAPHFAVLIDLGPDIAPAP